MNFYFFWWWFYHKSSLIPKLKWLTFLFLNLNFSSCFQSLIIIICFEQNTEMMSNFNFGLTSAVLSPSSQTVKSAPSRTSKCGTEANAFVICCHFFISKQLAGGFNPWITRSLVSLPIFAGKFLYSKVFKNYKWLQLWMGRRGEFSFSLWLLISSSCKTKWT